jgi:pimeloyl-ACP methyl ester carboxylesterase
MLIVTLSVLTILLAAALVVSPRFGERFYRRMVFAPIKAVPADYTLTALGNCPRQDVFFPSKGGQKLHAFYFRQENSPFTILFSHSNWGNVDEWSQVTAKLLQSGASVFAYDYRGYGLSEGKPSLKGICQDGISAYDYLVNVAKVDPKAIILFGGSLGTGVSCEIARQRPCAGIILHAAFSSLRALVIKLMPPTRFLPNLLFFRPALDNANRLSKLKTPLLILHGQYDEMAPTSQAETLLEASASTSKSLVILPGASHMQTDSQGGLFQKSLVYFVDGLGEKVN